MHVSPPAVQRRAAQSFFSFFLFLPKNLSMNKNKHRGRPAARLHLGAVLDRVDYMEALFSPQE